MGGPGRAGIQGPVGRYSTPEITPPPDDENAPGWGATALRVASGFAPGGPWGAVAGGVGEYAAQKAEGRDDLNLTQIGTQAALGLIPFRKGASALWSLLKGAGTGALMTTGAEAADQYHAGDFDAERLGTSALMGAGLGTLGGGIAHSVPSLIAGARASKAGGAAAGAVPMPRALTPTDLPAPRPIAIDAIGGPEHAAEVIRRVRQRKGLVQHPRGTDPEIMLGRQADDPPAGADLAPEPAAPDAPVNFDAPLTEAELTTARQGAPARTRLSPAAKRRERRAKLEASIRAAGGAPGGKPHYSAEQVAEHRTQAGYDTLAPDDVPTPAQAAARFPSLPEGDLRALLERFAFKRQEIDSAGLGFDDFVKRERRGPGLNAGNKEVDALDARYRTLTDPNSERGAASTDVLFDIAAPLTGAAVGAPLGAALEEDDRVGAVGGALAGGLAGLALRRPSALSTLQYGSMLSSPISMAKGIAGSTGSTLFDALEKGDLPAVLRNMASRDTARAAVAGFKAGGVPGRTRSGAAGPGSLWNPLRIPGRVLGAADAAGQDVLTRSGRTAEDAADSMLTGEPKSGVGTRLLNMQQGPVGETLLPFARTIINAAERGMEGMPGIGFLPGIRGMRNLDVPASAKKQGIGLLAMLGGAAAGEQASEHDEGSWGRRAWDIAPIAAGPFAIPAALGYSGALAGSKDNADPYSVSNAMVENWRQIVPAPEIPKIADYLSRAVPRDASELLGGEDPYSYDTSRSHLAKPISRIPWLNDYLLRQRAARGTGTTSTRRRASRPSRGGR